MAKHFLAVLDDSPDEEPQGTEYSKLEVGLASMTWVFSR
jgi:hypothetical protein